MSKISPSFVLVPLIPKFRRIHQIGKICINLESAGYQTDEKSVTRYKVRRIFLNQLQPRTIITSQSIQT